MQRFVMLKIEAMPSAASARGKVAGSQEGLCKLRQLGRYNSAPFRRHLLWPFGM